MLMSDEDKKEITDDLEIIDLLKVIASSKERVWLWQNIGERTVYQATLRKVDQIKKLVQINPTAQKGFQFESKDNVFLYSENKLIATKLSIREVESDYIVFSLPKKIMQVSESFVDGLELVERENEGAHAHERSHDRNEIHGEKFVKISFQHEPPSKGTIYYLNDISAGGMSFRVDDPGAFHKGDLIEVSEMHGKVLDTTMKGEVMSVRELSAAGTHYKVGVRFI